MDVNRLAASATLHCLTGCAVGEIIGAGTGSWLGWSNLASAGFAFGLAFITGYALSMMPLLRSGLALKAALRLALAADTVSILTMEVVDNAVELAIPGALNATPLQALFWSSMVVSLATAFAAAFPVNRYLLNRGQGHALMHDHHH